MNFDDPLWRLFRWRGDLKLKHRLLEMVPVQVEILSIQQARGTRWDIASAWNYLSVLYQRLGRYEEAEMAARNALTTYAAEQDPKAEVIATYEWVLAITLAAQRRVPDAVLVAESSLAHFAVFHDPPDAFLIDRKDDLEAIRAGRVPPLED